MDRRTTEQHQTILATLLEFRKLLYNCTEEMGHSSTRPPNVIAHDQFYQAFPALVLQAKNAGVRRPG